MIDRTDLQLMLCERVMDLDTDVLIELFAQLTGHELTVYDDETDTIVGSLEVLDIADPPLLKKWLGFLLYALGERIEMDDEESRETNIK